MKKIICVMLLVTGLVAHLVFAKPGMAASESGTVTGAARTTFTSAASLNSIALNGFDVGMGVFIEPNGSASGTFNAVLLGRSLLGLPLQITIDGIVFEGAITPDSRVFINGIATVSPGTGLPLLKGVPFRVTKAANSLQLTIGSTVLPVAQLTAGTISVE